MQTTDFTRFHALLLGMGELYAKAISKPMLDAYWVALRNWELPDFEAACARLMETATWMPRPSEFTALRKAGRQTPGEAFARAVQVSRGCSQGGYMSNNVTSDDPEIDRAVRALGGYCCIAMSDVDKLHFLERRFTEHYEAIQDAGDAREWLQLPRAQPHELTEGDNLAKIILRELTTTRTRRALGNGSN